MKFTFCIQISKHQTFLQVHTINLEGHSQACPIVRNKGLASLTSWGEGASLVLFALTSSDSVMIKMSYWVNVLHRPASHPIFSYWVG